MTGTKDGFQSVADEGDLREGDVLGVQVDGQPVVLVKLDGNVYALGSVCTHRQGDLGDGWLEGEMIRCPLHNSGFSVKTGEAVKPPARLPEPVYNVKVEDGHIWVSTRPRS